MVAIAALGLFSAATVVAANPNTRATRGTRVREAKNQGQGNQGQGQGNDRRRPRQPGSAERRPGPGDTRARATRARATRGQGNQGQGNDGEGPGNQGQEEDDQGKQGDEGQGDQGDQGDEGNQDDEDQGDQGDEGEGDQGDDQDQSGASDPSVESYLAPESRTLFCSTNGPVNRANGDDMGIALNLLDSVGALMVQLGLATPAIFYQGIGASCDQLPGFKDSGLWVDHVGDVVPGVAVYPLFVTA